MRSRIGIQVRCSLSRVLQLARQQIDVVLGRRAGRFDAEQIVADHRQGHQIGRRGEGDDLAHVVGAQRVVQIVAVRTAERLFVERQGRVAGRLADAVEHRLAVGEVLAELAEAEVDGDAVADDRHPVSAVGQVAEAVIELGEARLSDRDAPGCAPDRKAIRAGRAEAPAGWIDRSQQVGAVSRRKLEDAVGSGDQRGRQRDRPRLHAGEIDLNAGEERLAGIVDPVAVAVVEQQAGDRLGGDRHRHRERQEGRHDADTTARQRAAPAAPEEGRPLVFRCLHAQRIDEGRGFCRPFALRGAATVPGRAIHAIMIRSY
jgi:hypothetical protein